MEKLSAPTLIILIALISLIKGGVNQWVFMAWTLMILTYICFYSVRTKNAYKEYIEFFKRPEVIIFTGIQVWVFIQYLLPYSKDINSNLNFFLLGIGFLGLLFLLSNAIKKSNGTTIFYGFTLIALLQSTYGLFILLSGQNKLLWMDKLFYLDRPTGTFVNANHFAAYISLVIVLLLAYTISGKNIKKKLSVWEISDYVFNPYLSVTLVLLFALLMTKSIGAIVAMMIVLSIATIIFLLKKKNIKAWFFCGGISIAFSLLLLFYLDFSIIEAELAGLNHTINRRIALSTASWNMLTDFWFHGVGAGSFYSAFSEYRDLNIGNTYYNYAHNDYLQFWIEYGVIGTGLMVAFIVLALRKNLTVLKNSTNRTHTAFAYTSLYGSLMLGIHCFVDFPLHIPAYAALYLTVISVNIFTDPAKPENA